MRKRSLNMPGVAGLLGFATELGLKLLDRLHTREPRDDGKVYYPPKEGYEEEAVTLVKYTGVC